MSWGEDGGVGVGEAFRAVPPVGSVFHGSIAGFLLLSMAHLELMVAPRQAAGDWGALTGAVSPLEGQWTPVAVGLPHPPNHSAAFRRPWSELRWVLGQVELVPQGTVAVGPPPPPDYSTAFRRP